MLHLSESQSELLIQADGTRYFNAAYNLWQFNTYSIAAPSPKGGPPETKTDLYPGYPLFLRLFLSDGLTIKEFVNQILKVQAIIGSLTAVLAFIITRLSLGSVWAITAGILSAICPHLISIDGTVLSECLFTFVMISGALFVSLSLKSQNIFFTAIAGILFTMSAYIRNINMLLIVFIAPVYLYNILKSGFFSPKIIIKNISLLVFGSIIVIMSAFAFQQYYAANSDIDSSLKQHTSTKAITQAFIKGSYPGSKYEHLSVGKPFPWEYDPEFKMMWENQNYAYDTLKSRFLEKPLSYLKWFLGGKILFMWRWQDTATNDVYIYSMIRKGFSVNTILFLCYFIMYILHWPVFFLAYIFPVILLFRSQRKKELNAYFPLLCSFLIIMYTSIIISVLQSIPRYSIPLRPFFFILATGSLSIIISFISEKMGNFTPLMYRITVIMATTVVTVILGFATYKSNILSYFNYKGGEGLVTGLEKNKIFSEKLPSMPSYMAYWHCNYGKTLLEKDKVDRAIDHFQVSLTIKPEYITALNVLGVAKIQKNEFEQAILLFKKALQIDPEYVEARHNLDRLLSFFKGRQSAEQKN